jgi:hypothetical protein
VMSRVLRIAGYADHATAAKFVQERESTFAMIKPDCYQNFGKIIDAVQQEGFKINKLRMSKFN